MDTSGKATPTRLERMPGGGLEHLPDALARLGRALDVALGADLLRDGETLGAGHGALVHPREVLYGFGVVSQVLFARDEDDWQALAEVEHL
jgi:hypothetical protein